MRTPTLLGALAIVACVVAASRAVGSNPASSLTVGGPIAGLAADGGRALVLVERETPCADVVAWDRSRQKTVTVFDHGSCARNAALESYGPVALAGANAAFARTSGGNILESYVFVSSLVTGRTSRVAAEYAGGEGAYGRIVDDPTGDGRLLVYNDYLRCADAQTVTPPDVPCPAGVELGTIVSDQIHLALPARRVIATSTRELTVFAVGGGRVVVGAPDGSLVVLAPKAIPAGLVRYKGLRAERPIAAYPYKPNEVDGAVTDGRTLAVRRSGAVDVIPLPGNRSTRGRRTFRVGAERLTDLDGDIAVYLRGNAVHLLAVDSGRTVVFTRTTVAPADAQLEPDGLYVAAWKTVTFTPRAQVDKRLPR